MGQILDNWGGGFVQGFQGARQMKAQKRQMALQEAQQERLAAQEARQGQIYDLKVQEAIGKQQAAEQQRSALEEYSGIRMAGGGDVTASLLADLPSREREILHGEMEGWEKRDVVLGGLDQKMQGFAVNAMGGAYGPEGEESNQGLDEMKDGIGQIKEALAGGSMTPEEANDAMAEIEEKESAMKKTWGDQKAELEVRQLGVGSVDQAIQQNPRVPDNVMMGLIRLKYAVENDEEAPGLMALEKRIDQILYGEGRNEEFEDPGRTQPPIPEAMQMGSSQMDRYLGDQAQERQSRGMHGRTLNELSAQQRPFKSSDRKELKKALEAATTAAEVDEIFAASGIDPETVPDKL